MKTEPFIPTRPSLLKRLRDWVLKQWPVKEVARALDVSIGQVYVTKHRVSRLVRKEIQKLQKHTL